MRASEQKGAPLKRYAALSLLAAILLVAVFGYGAYLGDRYRREVRDVAHNVLGLGLAPGASETMEQADVPAVDTLSARHDGPARPPVAPPVAPVDRGDAGEPSVDGGAALPDPSQAASAAVPVPVDKVDGEPVPPAADPGAAEPGVAALARPEAPLDLPVTVRVKVLVDDPYVRSHPDWPSRVQRMLALASDAYRKATRIEFELVGIARFADPLDGLGEPALHALLAKQSRGGADVVVALVDREPSSTRCNAQPVGESRQGTRGLVGYGGLREDPLPQVMRCLGILLGGRTVEDPSSEAARLGSWMAKPAGTQRRLWLDGDNRARIMGRKALPFAEDGR